jgi:hypothetical protein
MTKQNPVEEKLPSSGDIPVVDHVMNPFENTTYLDLHYKDPEKNQHGIITVKTLQMEESDTYQRNRELRKKNKDLEDARDTGVHPQDPATGKPFYKGFDVIIAGYQISPSELRIALEKMSNHYGKKFYYIQPDNDNPVNALPNIQKPCDICGNPTPEENLELISPDPVEEIGSSILVCGDQCKTIANL